MLKKNFNKKNLPQIITIIINCILFIAVLFLMNYVESLLQKDSKINLTEIVTQNKNTITSKLNSEMSSVENLALSLADHLQGKEVTKEALEVAMDETRAAFEEDTAFAATKDGIAVFYHYQNLNISGRNYFKLSKEGIKNISDKLIARTDGDEVFIISVPLLINGNVEGTVQKFYSEKEMYNLCSLSLFSDKGTMNIIDKEGYILMSSQDTEYSNEKDNYFRLLYSLGNKEQSLNLEENLKNDKEGFMEINTNGEDSFSVYTPIEGIHDWCLITSVAKGAVSPNGNIVIKLFYIILSIVVLVFGASMMYFTYFKNKQQGNLEKLAFVDDVTKGNTLTKFMVDFANISRRVTDDLYLLKFDIDNFKYVNNYFGFDYGDRMLYKIYQTIASKLKEDESMCRVSSDHFIVLLKGDASETRLEDMMKSVEAKDEFQLYFSAGVYKISNREENLSTMMDKASIAANASKGSLDKKIEIYLETFDQEMIHNEQMKRAVKAAIKDREIIPFYQPKVDINTNKIVGAEALARWINKDGKLVYPDQFIPLCEKSGLIVKLDMLIFEEVLEFIRHRLDNGLECVPISVNFSRNHLLDAGFISSITKLMEMYDIPRNLVEIEITESAFMNNLVVMNHFVKDLHDNGFMISMDDFGSGYSSLNMLKDVQIDVLKIDREFLKNSENSDKQKIIFSAISKMAKELEIKVVVEGVETQENIQMMKMFGCSIAQGYFYAKPLSQQDYETFIKEGLHD